MIISRLWSINLYIWSNEVNIDLLHICHIYKYVYLFSINQLIIIIHSLFMRNILAASLRIAKVSIIRFRQLQKYVVATC